MERICIDTLHELFYDPRKCIRRDFGVLDQYSDVSGMMSAAMMYAQRLSPAKKTSSTVTRRTMVESTPR